MGREQHILLSILGLLAGTFVGVLSMKLLSPRPPDGAGGQMQSTARSDAADGTVKPPEVYAVSDISTGEPESGAGESLTLSQLPPDRYADNRGQSTSAFVGGDSAVSPSVVDAVDMAGDSLVRDPFQSPAESAAPPALKEPNKLDADMVVLADPIGSPQMDQAAFDGAAGRLPPGEQSGASHVQQSEISTATYSNIVQDPPIGVRVSDGSYVTVVGDSWWSLAERLYGDGRYYRALFAWNRSLNPRVSLVPGTQLEVPAQSKLSAAWPHLLPVE